jgi:tripartite-type tricarboxylate transporter receptor subunit TctC
MPSGTHRRGQSTSVAKVLLLALVAGIASNACAQSWPARPVRIIVPFVPGGGTDIQARLLAKKFTESMGQSFVVENRGGAGGLIGAELVAKSAPDGYNILVSTASLAVNVSLYKKIAFDPVESRAGKPDFIIAARADRASQRAHKVGEGTGRARQAPQRQNECGIRQCRRPSHLAIEMLNQMAGIE